MARYQVLAQGYHGGVLYTPGDVRHGFLVTNEPLKPVPKWLKPVNDESAAHAKASAKAKADAKEAVDTAKADIKGASFMSDKSSVVETL